jgi:serine/threonine protein kinase
VIKVGEEDDSFGATPALSPERIEIYLFKERNKTANSITQAADIWSIGCLFSILLYGYPQPITYLQCILTTLRKLDNALTYSPNKKIKLKDDFFGMRKMPEFLELQNQLISYMKAYTEDFKQCIINAESLNFEDFIAINSKASLELVKTFENNDKNLKSNRKFLDELHGNFLKIRVQYTNTEQEAMELDQVYANLKKAIQNYRASLKEKTAKIWDILNNLPEPAQKEKKLLWHLSRPNPQERICAQGALDLIDKLFA